MDKFVGPKKCPPNLKKSIIKTNSAKKKNIYIYIYKDDIKRKKILNKSHTHITCKRGGLFMAA